MRKFVFITLAALTMLSCKKEVPIPFLPEEYVFTGDYSSLTPYSVTLTGTVNPTSSMREISMGIYLSKNPEPSEYNSSTYRIYDGNNTFSHEFTGLEPETTYYYKAFMYHREGFTLEKWDYGEIKSFTTPANSITTTFDYIVAGVSSVYLRGSVSIEYESPRYAYSSLITGDSRAAVINRGQDADTYYLGTERTFEITAFGMKEGGMYYRTCVVLGDEEYLGEIQYVSPREFVPTDGEVIDMGLSVKWRSRNVGADSPEEGGNYYSWGETSTKSFYTSEHYTHPEGDPLVLPLTMDAASVNLGGKWRMPTREEFLELDEKCLCGAGEYNSMPGLLVVSKINGNAIFFPAAGFNASSAVGNYGSQGKYWSSTAEAINPQCVYSLFFSLPFTWTYLPVSSSSTAYFGASIRPVM